MDKRITPQLQPGRRDAILARAPAAQAAPRAEPGRLACGSFDCTDDPDRRDFVDAWASKQARNLHKQQTHPREWIAVHGPKRPSFRFETIDAEP